MKEENIKVNSSVNPKGWCCHKSNLSRKATFKAPTPGLKDKVFDFGKQLHAVEFTNTCEAISKFIALNYKRRGTRMDMAINKMDNTVINMPKSPKGTASRVHILLSKKYK